MFKLTRSLSGLAALSAVVAFGFAGACEDDSKGKAAEGTSFTKEEADAVKLAGREFAALKTRVEAAHLLGEQPLKDYIKAHAHSANFIKEGSDISSDFAKGVSEIMHKHNMLEKTTDGYKGLASMDGYKAIASITQQGVDFSNAASEAMKGAKANSSLKASADINYPTSKFTLVAA